MSVQETNSDFKKGKDSSTTLIERDYSDLKPEEAFKKETDSKLRKKKSGLKRMIQLHLVPLSYFGITEHLSFV